MGSYQTNFPLNCLSYMVLIYTYIFFFLLEANAPIRRQSIFRPDENGDVYEYHRFQHYGFKTPAPSTFSLESMLAFLAPLATLPIITSAALTSLASILPTLATDGKIFHKIVHKCRQGRGERVIAPSYLNFEI